MRGRSRCCQLLFRWRAQFGLTARKALQLAWRSPTAWRMRCRRLSPARDKKPNLHPAPFGRLDPVDAFRCRRAPVRELTVAFPVILGRSVRWKIE
jgi:hypothetical protein